jgi:hypothetical protein
MKKFKLTLRFLILFWSTIVNAEPLFKYYFVEVKSYKESSKLPPRLNVTFDIHCNEEFIKVIRNDLLNTKTKETNIALGVLVKENLLSSCAGTSKEMTVSAGKTFSGKQYSISLIKSTRQ